MIKVWSLQLVELKKCTKNKILKWIHGKLANIVLTKCKTNKYKINKLVQNQQNEKQLCFIMLVKHTMDI